MMGGAFGSSYASIFPSKWEERALSVPTSPLLWLIYIDDVFGVWPFSEAELKDFVSSEINFNAHVSVTLTLITFLTTLLYSYNFQFY